MKKQFIWLFFLLSISCSKEALEIENEKLATEQSLNQLSLINFTQKGTNITSLCDLEDVFVFENDTHFTLHNFDLINNECTLIATINGVIDNETKTFSDDYGYEGVIEITADNVVLVYTGELEGTVVTYNHKNEKL